MPKSEIRLAEERFQNCIQKRNAFNEESRTIRDERDSLHNQRNKVMKEVLKYRKKMEVNKKTKVKHMKSRDAATAKVKEFNELKQQKRNRHCTKRKKLFLSIVYLARQKKTNIIKKLRDLQ